MLKRKSKEDKKIYSKKSKTETSEHNDKIGEENRANEKSSNASRLTWPETDLLNLVEKIEGEIPEGDSISYTSRIEKINWEEVAFKDYSVKECKETWNLLQKQIRKFRLLKEIATDIKEWIVKSPKKAPKSSVQKHPDMPKQPLNSFMFFVEEKRSQVVKQYPDLKSHEVSKKLGHLFNELPSNEREHYSQLAKEARIKYTENLNEFYENHPELVVKKKNKRAKNFEFRDGTGPPLKPKTPFELFLSSEREKSDVDKSGLLMKCRNLWNEMPDTEKLFWINWSCEEQKKYEEDIKNYVKDHPKFEPEKMPSILTKNEIKIKERLSGKPEKPPRTAYHLFTKMMGQNEDVRDLNAHDTLHYISEKWKACSEEDKNEYKTRLEQMWKEYDIKLKEFVKSLPSEERDDILQTEMKKKSLAKTSTKEVAKTSHVKLKKPKKPPLDEYKYFCSVYKGKKKPSKVWQDMTKEEKLVYEEGFELSKQNYITLYEQYLKSLSKEELEKFRESLHNTSSSDSLSVCSSSSFEI